MTIIRNEIKQSQRIIRNLVNIQHFHCSVHKKVQTVWRQAQKLLLQFVAMVRVTVNRLISVHVLPVVIRIQR